MVVSIRDGGIVPTETFINNISKRYSYEDMLPPRKYKNSKRGSTDDQPDVLVALDDQNSTVLTFSSDGSPSELVNPAEVTVEERTLESPEIATVEEHSPVTPEAEPAVTAQDDTIGAFSFVGGSEHDINVAMKLRSRKSRAKNR